VTREQERRGALEALERVVNRGGDSPDVARDALGVLRRLYPQARLEPADAEIPDGRTSISIRFEGADVAAIHLDRVRDEDRAFLDRFATLVSPYCRGRAGTPT
jgi:hypothetical protein